MYSSRQYDIMCPFVVCSLITLSTFRTTGLLQTKHSWVNRIEFKFDQMEGFIREEWLKYMNVQRFSLPESLSQSQHTSASSKLKLPPIGVGRGGSWNSQFLVSLPYICHIPNLVMIWPVVLEKKILTHDGRRGCLPIAIGHLSGSGILKM